MFLLPSDLSNALMDIEKSLEQNLNSGILRFTIELRFEGLKFNQIGFKVFEIISKKYKTFLTFADSGAVALAQRDYEAIKANIFTFKSFKESEYILDTNSVLVSMLPQPYDFDFFEPMCDEFKGIHISINPKFEDANIGIGSVIRERRKNFVRTWNNIYYLQPLNKGALMHIAPDNWALFKEREGKYFFVKGFESKPDNETIFINL